MAGIKELVAERAKTHGEFWKTAECAQILVGATHYQPDGPFSGWGALSLVQREALDNIQRKIARILTGNPDHRDAWQDIQGYCQLVLDRMAPETDETTKEVPIQYFLYHGMESLPFLDCQGYHAAVANAKNNSRSSDKSVIIRWNSNDGPHRMEFEKGNLLSESHPS